MIGAIFPVVCSTDLERARDFYRDLLGLDVAFECGWYSVLNAPGRPAAQLGLVSIGHDSVPAAHSRTAAGVLITVEVDDVDEVHEKAVAMGLTPAVSLRDEAFGQRHFMVEGPDGLLVDVVQFIAPARSFLHDVATWRRSHR